MTSQLPCWFVSVMPVQKTVKLTESARVPIKLYVGSIFVQIKEK